MYRKWQILIIFNYFSSNNYNPYCDLFMINSRRSSTFVLWCRFKLIYNQGSMCVACYTLNEAMRSFIFCCGIPYTLKLLELSRLFECIFFLTNVISCKSQTILTQLKLIFFISFFSQNKNLWVFTKA